MSSFISWVDRLHFNRDYAMCRPSQFPVPLNSCVKSFPRLSISATWREFEEPNGDQKAVSGGTITCRELTVDPGMSLR